MPKTNYLLSVSTAAQLLINGNRYKIFVIEVDDKTPLLSVFVQDDDVLSPCIFDSIENRWIAACKTRGGDFLSLSP